MTATKLFLNGDFKSSSDGKTIPQTNPATEIARTSGLTRQS